MFSAHTSPDKFKRGQFEFVFKKPWVGKLHDYLQVIVFKKLCFHNLFCHHDNEKSSFLNFSGLKSVFEKLRFRHGLVWTVGLTVDIRLRLQIPPP